jgi:hypothetical protein
MTSSSSSTDAAIVTVAVPADLNYQLVYRLDRSEPVTVAPRSDVTFCWLEQPGKARALAGELRRLFGWVGFAKLCAKLCTSRRRFYAVLRDGRVVHHGWATAGLCKHYSIESNAVVIGPIWTAHEARGKQIGTYALLLAINHLIGEGHHLFYIDTSKANVPCQKLIGHCGFGMPVAVLTREPEKD